MFILSEKFVRVRGVHLDDTMIGASMETEK
ncbi:MAG: hypothetical protein ACI8RD_004046 [Bacillariaceae sp.]|jgi:hypothetical protein